MKKIIFWGTPYFTIDFLEKLKANDLKPTLIITGPDRPAGRGLKLSSPEPKKWALANKIKFLQPEKIDEELYQELVKENWDLSIVIAYGKILPEKIINLPHLGTINVHYSLLPKYRGASPIESAILNNENITGVTIQQMRYQLDAGAILSQNQVTIDRDENSLSLFQKLNQAAIPLLIETCQKIFSGAITPLIQDKNKATSCTKIKKSDTQINLTEDPIYNYRKIRAYLARGVFFLDQHHNQTIRVKIMGAHLEESKLKIDEVIPANQKKMTFDQYLNWRDNSPV